MSRIWILSIALFSLCALTTASLGLKVLEEVKAHMQTVPSCSLTNITEDCRYNYKTQEKHELQKNVSISWLHNAAASNHHEVTSAIGQESRIMNVLNSSNRSNDEATEAESLSHLLALVVQEEMEGCSLVLAYDEYYRSLGVLELLFRRLPHSVPRQVVEVRAAEDVLGVDWGWAGGCRGYLFLLVQPEPLLQAAATTPLTWDYRGRYLVVASTQDTLVALATSLKGRKTEHLAAAVKTGLGAWRLYVNLLYVAGQATQAAGSVKNGALSGPLNLFPDKLSNLHGARLSAATFEWAPSVFYYRDADGSVLFRYGTDIGVLETVAQVMNFTVRYQEPPAVERWGREEEAGQWSGMMGMLARDEVDIGLVDLYVTIVRVGILDYTTPYDSELSCFMARTEPPVPRWRALAYPFQGTTWLAILVGLVISGPVLYLLARGSAHCGREVALLQSLSASWYYSVGLHCCEAQVTLPKQKSTRIFVIFLWLYCITLTIAYSTNLTAYLLVVKPPDTMQTIRDLHDSGLEVSGVGGFYGDALGFASDPYLQNLKERFRSYDEASEIFPRVLEGRAVMIQNSPFLEYVAATKFTSRGVSSMRLMKECFAPFNIAMAVQRHSPLKRKFDQVIGWVVSAGLVRHFFLRSLRLSTQNAKMMQQSRRPGGVAGGEGDSAEGTGEVEGVTPLSLEHMQGIFFIISIGWLLSILVFLLEMIV